MEPISLSIEELIYSFYSDGFFEQGNALKQVYFDEMTDEKMDLLLQISCRSLLAKDLLTYKNHKFELTDQLNSIISALNYSEISLRASRHGKESKEQSISYHFSDGKIIMHSLYYDEQIHRFQYVTLESIYQDLMEFYGVYREEQGDSFVVSENTLEEMIEQITDNNKQFDKLSTTEELLPLFSKLKQSEGLLNTLMAFEFTEAKEPIVTNLALFTSLQKENLMLVKNEQVFEVTEASYHSIKSYLDDAVSAYTKS
jgi:hypothetical protein